MGVTVNLIELWEPFKAARLALANTLESSNIQDYAQQHAKNLEVCYYISKCLFNFKIYLFCSVINIVEIT